MVLDLLQRLGGDISTPDWANPNPNGAKIGNDTGIENFAYLPMQLQASSRGQSPDPPDEPGPAAAEPRNWLRFTPGFTNQGFRLANSCCAGLSMSCTGACDEAGCTA